MDFINTTFEIGDHFAGYYTEQVFGKAEQHGNVNKFFGTLMYLILIPITIILFIPAAIMLVILGMTIGF